jgi:cytoskeletal protein RodZ
MMRTDVEHLVSGAKSHLNLAGARLEKGVTLEEIAQSTRIAGHFLEAIETENFGQLPGGVYNTSYIRQYARAIGYDETALLGHYRSQIEPPKMAVAEPPSSFFRVDEALRNVFQYVITRGRSHHPA